MTQPPGVKCPCERCELLEEKLCQEKEITGRLFQDKLILLGRIADLEHRAVDRGWLLFWTVFLTGSCVGALVVFVIVLLAR